MCAFCGLHVTDQKDLVIELARADDSLGDKFHVHSRCFVSWDSVRKRR